MTDNLATALAAVQAKLPKVNKDKKADTGKYGYRYADLSSVAEAIHPLLSEHGLAWVTMPTLNEHGQFVLRYELLHGPSGESKVGECPLPDPMSHGPQQIGSAVTYYRRYCLTAVTGVVPDEDDDGKAAAESTAGRSTRPKRAERGPVPDAERSTFETPPPDPEPVVDGVFVEDWLRKVEAAGSKGDMTALWAEMIGAHRGRKIDDETRRMLTEKFEARGHELNPGAAA